jgi:outer membrane protein OmpA-like peptidoglycan-associated protein
MMLNRQVLMAAVAGVYLPMILQAADPPNESTTVLSGQQIEQALQHPAMTRSFVPSRGLTRQGTPEAQQSVNLNIPFEHNSSALQPQAAAQLQQLESALTSASLGKDRFMVAGHTDGQRAIQQAAVFEARRSGEAFLGDERRAPPPIGYDRLWLRALAGA